MSSQADQSESQLILNSSVFFEEMVAEAVKIRKINTIPRVEVYLAELLSSFISADNLYEVDETNNTRKTNTLAELYLTASSESLGPKRISGFKKTGDLSLYISGFFGDSLTRKVVDIDYYAGIGGSAYKSLARELSQDLMAQVFDEISTRFLEFVDVLTYLSQTLMVQSNSDLLRLYDRYLATGSTLAKEQLIEKGILIENKKIAQ